jgi:hypothetical protein
VRKHRTAAAWIERLAGDRVTDHADILAHHYAQALQLAKAAGLDDDTHELEVQGRRFLIMAGDRALELTAVWNPRSVRQTSSPRPSAPVNRR